MRTGNIFQVEQPFGKCLVSHFPSAGMRQSLPGLKVGEFKAELLGSGRKWPGVGVWVALIPPLLFPPENPQADSSVSSLPLLEAKIHQTHSLARLLTKYAEQLLQEYVSVDAYGGARGLGHREVQITGFPDHQFYSTSFSSCRNRGSEMNQ